MLCDKIDKASLPLFLSVAGDRFIGEEKFDGDRIRMRVKDNKVTLTNRRGNDVTEKYPEIRGLKGDFFVDGEMCVMINGISAFNEGISFRTHCKSQETIREAMNNYPVTYCVFDVIEHNGKDLRDQSWTDRRKILEGLDLNHKNIEISKVSNDIMSLWTEVTSKGGEGVIIKDVNGVYTENKRSSLWRKVKDVHEVDLTFTKFERHPKGITLENKEGIRVVVNGFQAEEVVQQITRNGQIVGTINHLGNVTANGKFRQPTWKKLVR